MTYDFYLYGRFDAARAAACATTFALLRSVPGLVRNSQCGFSRLAAEDRIGAHRYRSHAFVCPGVGRRMAT